MSANAELYRMAERARERSPSGPAARPRAERAKVPRFTYPGGRCPLCRSAAEDGRNLKRNPFTGLACFWCGACHDSDGHGGWNLLERTVPAADPPRKRAPVPEGRWGVAWRVLE